MFKKSILIAALFAVSGYAQESFRLEVPATAPSSVNSYIRLQPGDVVSLNAYGNWSDYCPRGGFSPAGSGRYESRSLNRSFSNGTLLITINGRVVSGYRRGANEPIRVNQRGVLGFLMNDWPGRYNDNCGWVQVDGYVIREFAPPQPPQPPLPPGPRPPVGGISLGYPTYGGNGCPQGSTFPRLRCLQEGHRLPPPRRRRHAHHPRCVPGAPPRVRGGARRECVHGEEFRGRSRRHPTHSEGRRARR